MLRLTGLAVVLVAFVFTALAMEGGIAYADHTPPGSEARRDECRRQLGTSFGGRFQLCVLRTTAAAVTTTGTTAAAPTVSAPRAGDGGLLKQDAAPMAVMGLLTLGLLGLSLRTLRSVKS